MFPFVKLQRFLQLGIAIIVMLYHNAVHCIHLDSLFVTVFLVLLVHSASHALADAMNGSAFWKAKALNKTT